MDESLRQLSDSLRDAGRTPSPDELRGLIDSYPWFAAPVAAMLRHYSGQLHDDELRRLRLRLSLIIGGDAADFEAGASDSAFYPPQQRQSDTDKALDTFFNTFGHSTPEEDALLERLIFNPVPDYADLLAHDEGQDAPVVPGDLSDLAASLRRPAPQPAGEATEDGNEQGEAAPAATQPEKRRSAPPASDPQGDPGLLSESLAKIFIKQGRYQRAYEIISNLNLNYPEKSIYFADQLRFLRKLILIQQKKSGSDQSTQQRDDE